MVEIFWTLSEGELFDFLLKLPADSRQILLDEFLSERDEHIAQLVRDFSGSDLRKKEVLNLSRESLEPLWSWARTRLSRHQYSPTELEEINTMPPLQRRGFLNNPPKSEGTKRLEFDVACYFGEVIIHTESTATWTIQMSRVNRDVDANYPVVTCGKFKNIINPIRLVSVQGWKSLRGTGSDFGLVELYDKWSTWPE